MADTVRLGEVAKVISGYAFKSSAFTSSGVPVIKIANIRVGDVDLQGSQCVAHDYIEAIDEKYRVSAGDVLISLTGSQITQPNSVVGRVARQSRNAPLCLLNQRAGKVIIQNPDNCDKAFVYYALFRPETRKLLASMGHGAASQANVSPSQVETLEIPSLTIKHQRRIGAILSAYDDLIENNMRRIHILEEIARRIYEEWFVRFRFPGHKNIKMVESELGLIPDRWDVKTLGEVCLRITDGSHSSPPSVQAGLPMASVKDMNNWGIKLETCRHISAEDYEQLVRNDCKPLLNDVLIAKDGSYLKHIFVVDKEIDLVILSSIAILRPNDKIGPDVLGMYLKQPTITQRMKGYVSGVAIPRIVLKDFRQFKIVVPPIRLQSDWATLAEPLLAACRNLNGKNSVLRRTRDLLLPKLFSGEVDVSTL